MGSSWFNEARYGMFVHFGPYSLAARGEWVANRECIAQPEYDSGYCRKFNPREFDADALCQLAVDGGMGYIVLTTRHHDGYCMWRTATSERNSIAMGADRDFVEEITTAARRHGLRIGLYLSAADWFHPDYPSSTARDWPREWPDAQAHERMRVYVREQVRELMSNYGRIDVLWWDGCLPRPFDGPEVNRLAKALQPGIMINERMCDDAEDCWDFRVSEQTTRAKEGPWEACMTLNDNWGYHAGDSNWKNPKDVVRLLTATAGNGGNLLLNVGPRGDGSLPEESSTIIRAVGEWLKDRREFLSNSGRSPFGWNNYGNVTVKGPALYLHVFNPHPAGVCFAELANPVKRVRLLSSGKELSWRKDGRRLLIEGLPLHPEQNIATTIAIDTEGEPRPVTEQETFWIPE